MNSYVPGVGSDGDGVLNPSSILTAGAEWLLGRVKNRLRLDFKALPLATEDIDGFRESGGLVNSEIWERDSENVEDVAGSDEDSWMNSGSVSKLVLSWVVDRENTAS